MRLFRGGRIPHCPLFDPTKEAEGIIQDIVAASDLDAVQDFVVQFAVIPNAAAAIWRDKRYILYNLQTGDEKVTSGPWVVRSSA